MSDLIRDRMLATVGHDTKNVSDRAVTAMSRLWDNIGPFDIASVPMHRLGGSLHGPHSYGYEITDYDGEGASLEKLNEAVRSTNWKVRVHKRGNMSFGHVVPIVLYTEYPTAKGGTDDNEIRGSGRRIHSNCR